MLVAYTAGHTALAVMSVGTSLGQVNTSLQEAAKVSFLGCYRELLFVLLRLETDAIDGFTTLAVMFRKWELIR